MDNTQKTQKALDGSRTSRVSKPTTNWKPLKNQDQDEGPRPIRSQWRSEEYAVRQFYVNRILRFFELERCDILECFASKYNHWFEQFWDKSNGAFKEIWSGQKFWLNPPYSQLCRVVLKFLKDKTEDSVLIAPVWESTEWFQVAKSMAKDILVFPRGTLFFELVDCEYRVHAVGPVRWEVAAILISYKHFQKGIVKASFGSTIGQVCSRNVETKAAKRRLRRKKLEFFKRD
jgi:hypothetical protein